VRERDRIARPYPQPSASREVVDRACDDPETHAIKLAEQRGDPARQRAIHEGLQQDGFSTVLALVHRDELAENGIGAVSARAPSLDPADQPLRPSPQRRIDEPLLRGCVQVDRAGRDVGAPRDFADSEVGISAAGDLAQGR
jgi:hypothetical protein